MIPIKLVEYQLFHSSSGINKITDWNCLKWEHHYKWQSFEIKNIKLLWDWKN